MTIDTYNLTAPPGIYTGIKFDDGQHLEFTAPVVMAREGVIVYGAPGGEATLIPATHITWEETWAAYCRATLEGHHTRSQQLLAELTQGVDA